MQAVSFTNYTDQDFTWKFDGIEYTFPAKSSMFMEDYKAEHFAKHLIDRELTVAGKLTNDVNERKRLWTLCFPSGETVTPAVALDIEAKKVVKKGKKVEPEFPDLNK